MALPLVPALKLIALSSIKIVVLGLGAVIVPVFTVRVVLGGTGESVRTAAQWMRDSDKLTAAEADEFLSGLDRVQQADLSRGEARELLFSMIKKTVDGMTAGVRNGFAWFTGLFRSNS